jgi:sarcosine oxidase
VVGGGVIGLAAASALADVGAEVMCLEKGEPGGGQSAGQTRTFRHLHDDPGLLRLAVEARQGWNEWEARASRRLLGREGLVMVGPDKEPHVERLAEAGVPFALLDQSQQSDRLGILAPFEEQALLDQHAGAIRARRTIETLRTWLGPKHLMQTEVLGIRSVAAGATLDTTEGVWDCRRVVVCCGVETARLAQAVGVEIPVKVFAHARPMFRTWGRPALACWVDDSRRFGETVYGAPVGGSGMFVVGLKTIGGDEPIDDQVPYLPASNRLDAAVGRVSRYVAEALPGLDPSPVEVRICLATRLAGHRDACEISGQGNITYFTGHNAFKFAPAIGKMLADAALRAPAGDEATTPDTWVVESPLRKATPMPSGC